MQLTKEKKKNNNIDAELIESTYVIYTPKIIKFVYRGTQKKINEKAYLNNQMKSAALNSLEKSRNLSKNLGQSTHSKKSQRVGKIHLISTKKPVIRLKGKCKQKRNKTELSQQQNSQNKSKVQNLQFPQYKNHITTNDFVQSFGCSFFSDCNDNSDIDIGQRLPLSFDNSRKTIQKSERQITEGKVDGQSIKKEEQNSQSNGKSLYDFKKRKNIFAGQSLNKTFDLAYKEKDRSRSRKSIFQQRYKLCDLSFSKDRSISTRKKIFEAYPPQQKSRITVKSHEQQLQECEIPKSIYEQWQKFSPQSESKQQVQNRQILQTVQQLKMQQSQVKWID